MRHTKHISTALIAVSSIFFVGAFGLFLVQSEPAVHAQATSTMTADQIRNKCTSIRSSLNTIHTNDTLMRVNIGQTYNTISAKLMARMNARLAVYRVPTSGLTDITSHFEKNRELFGTDFNKYDTAITALQKIDCTKSPSEFYNQLIVTRDARHRISVHVSELNDDIQSYKRQLQKLEPTIKSQQSQDGVEE